MNKWLPAEDHPTKGYARRPGWHATPSPNAPHLSMRDRKWFVVELRGVKMWKRPETQGGNWCIAEQMRVLHPLVEEVKV